MNGKQRFVAPDFFADLFNPGEADREIDLVIGTLATGAEQDRGAPDQFGVHFFDDAGRFSRERLGHWRAMDFSHLFERGRVAILRVNERDEFFPGAAIL